MKYFRSRQYPIEFVLSEGINKDFSSHNHANHYVLSFCATGNATAILEGSPLLLKENDFFIVPPFMPHAVKLSDTSILVSLCLGKSFLAGYSPQKGIEILEASLLSPNLQQQVTNFQARLLLQAIPQIYEFHLTCKRELESDMAALCDCLTNNLTDSIPLDQLASKLYINKYYLIRKCKKYLGLTPHKFHLQNRVRKAQDLLGKNKSIIEASVSTGFYDQSHFNKSFKNIVGISPREYLAATQIL